ncbi:MAG: BolA/IbaG family iron-sulfur metabolism protein [Bdellovibrionota bacterium]
MTIRETIEARLAAFNPHYLLVEDESHSHNVPAGAESHFKVILVSPQFEGKRLLERHRSVNSALSDLLKTRIHALALHTFTEKEWQQKHSTESPPCLGGSKE